MQELNILKFFNALIFISRIILGHMTGLYLLGRGFHIFAL